MRKLSKIRFVTIYAHGCGLFLFPMPFAIYKHKTTNTQVRIPNEEVSAHSHYFPTEGLCDFSQVTSALELFHFCQGFFFTSLPVSNIPQQSGSSWCQHKEEIEVHSQDQKMKIWISTDLNQLELIQNGSCVCLHGKVKMGILGKGLLPVYYYV